MFRQAARASPDHGRPDCLGMPVDDAWLVRHIIENEMHNVEVIRLDAVIWLAPK